MKIRKDYIVQAKFAWGWDQANSVEANGLYTEASAKKRARAQTKNALNWGIKYRAKKVKAKK